MSLHQSRVLAFAVSRGFMPLGVAQSQVCKVLQWMCAVSRGFMPLGVAQEVAKAEAEEAKRE